jgi:quercetin dioxygenase-like cupin family protein
MEESAMSGQTNDADGIGEARDAEGARSRPQGQTTATESREVQHLQEDFGHFDLGAEAASLTAEARSSATGRSSKTLVKLPHLHLTVTAVNAGTRIEEHQNHAPVAILGLVGTFRVEAGPQTVQLGAQQIVSLGAQVPHSVEALEDCVFLLTVGWGTEAAQAAEASHQRAQLTPI